MISEFQCIAQGEPLPHVAPEAEDETRKAEDETRKAEDATRMGSAAGADDIRESARGMMTVGLTPPTSEAFTPSTEALAGVGTMERVVDIQIGMHTSLHARAPHHSSLTTDHSSLVPHHSHH